MTDLEYASAASVIDRRDAGIVSEALQQAGIQCWSSVDNASLDVSLAVGHGTMGAPSGIVIMVLREDLERAKQIISTL